MSTELVNVERDMNYKNKELHDLRLTNEEMGRTLNDLRIEYQRRQVELAEQRKLGEKCLVQADENTDMVTLKLINMCILVDDWKAKCEQLEIVHQKLKAARNMEVCQTQTTLSELHGECENMSIQLKKILSELTATMTNNQQLLITSKKKAEWLAGLKAQVDRMEQRKGHECLMQSIEQIKCDAEMTLLNNEQIVEDHKQLLARNDVNEQRWFSNCSGFSLIT